MVRIGDRVATARRVRRHAAVSAEVRHEHIGGEVLRAMLASTSLAEQRGGVADVCRRASAYQTSFPVEEVDVTFADGSSAPLILKNLRFESLGDAAAHVKPPFLHDPLREVIVYRELL